MRKETTLTQQEENDYIEASYHYSLFAFEEFLKSKRFGHLVWKDLSSEAKALIRSQVAIEQLKSESGAL
jgi:hypothetical protein